MIPLADLRQYSTVLTAEKFVEEMGTFLLLSVPTGADLPYRQVLDDEDVPTRAVNIEVIRAKAQTIRAKWDVLEAVLLPPLRESDELRIGRLPTCDLVIEDGSVSKEHALLRWDGTHRLCTLVDLGSTNGTVLNGQILGSAESRPLKDGDIISVGESNFVYFTTREIYNILRRTEAAI